MTEQLTHVCPAVGEYKCPERACVCVLSCVFELSLVV